MSNINVLPELANKYNKNKHNIEGWYMSEKLDGVRAWWFEGKLYSREGNIFYSPNYFTENFPHDITLDGELYMGKHTFQRCVSTVKRHKPTDDWKELVFVVFDAPLIKKPFSDRLNCAKIEINNCNSSYIRVLEQVKCLGNNNLIDYHNNIDREGGEGVMLRNPHEFYNEYGKRTNNILKVKTMHDAEAKVLYYEMGKGKHTGRVGALVCEMIDDKKHKFKIGTGLIDRERDNPPSIGSVITYKYFELTKLGVPRFPVYFRQCEK